jgi:hypothetical protein
MCRGSHGAGGASASPSLAYEETPGRAERVEAAFSAIVSAADTLAADMGEQASASAVAEAMITLDIRPYPWRVLAVASLPGGH